MSSDEEIITHRPILVSVEKAAEILGIGRSLVYSLIAEGQLLSIKLGHRRLIPLDEIVALVERELEDCQTPELSFDHDHEGRK